jgi:FR47-like protein
VYIRTANVHDAAAIATIHVESWRTSTRLIQEGMTALLLWVLAANPARKFYERLGGQPVYEKTVTIGGVPLIEVAYRWRNAHTITAPSQW